MVKLGVIRTKEEKAKLLRPNTFTVLVYNVLCVLVFAMVIIFVCLGVYYSRQEFIEDELPEPIVEEEPEREIEIWTEPIVDESSMKLPMDKSLGKDKSRLDVLKEEMEHIIETGVSVPQKFNVLAFATTITFWKSQPVDYSAESAGEAVRWVKRLEANGETDIYNALKEALNQKDVRAIYFLTDGEPTYNTVEEIILMIREETAKLTQSVKIHTSNFFGDESGIKLLQRIAEITGGVFTDISW